MAISPGLLSYFVEYARLQRGASVLDIGAQEFVCATDPESINRFLVHFGAAPYAAGELDKIAHNGTYVGDTFVRAGFTYAAIDIAPAPHTFRLDLDSDTLPEAHRGRYDLVDNSGTTEHVLNQLNAFRVIHDAVKVGGMMCHVVPMADFQHGFFSYGPKFFWALASANNYELVDFRAYISPTPAQVPADWLREIHFNVRPDGIDIGQHVLLRRTADAPFRRFFDSSYGP
jgi:hypothetical protein